MIDFLVILPKTKNQQDAKGLCWLIDQTFSILAILMTNSSEKLAWLDQGDW